MVRLLIILFICIASSCTSRKSTRNLELPILDLSLDYQVREMDLHDIADVEYIALETIDSTLIGIGSSAYISDKYIVASEGVYGDR